MMGMMSGVSGVISAAHYSRDGVLHGHTWQVVVWWAADDAVILSAEHRKRMLRDYLEKFDHKVLTDELAWGEHLAERIGLEMSAIAVDVSRPLEGIYAKWFIA
jgi:6-pyruvoyl-tetrahydropterin synthase